MLTADCWLELERKCTLHHKSPENRWGDSGFCPKMCFFTVYTSRNVLKEIHCRCAESVTDSNTNKLDSIAQWCLMVYFLDLWISGIFLTVSCLCMSDSIISGPIHRVSFFNVQALSQKYIWLLCCDMIIVLLQRGEKMRENRSLWWVLSLVLGWLEFKQTHTLPRCIPLFSR